MDEDLKKLLEENLTLTREVHDAVVSIRRTMKWQRAMSIIYFIIIVGPIILAFIFLPPVIQNYVNQYDQVMQNFSSSSSGVSLPPGQDFSGVLKQLENRNQPPAVSK